MRFLVDASCDARICVHLRSLGHDVTRIGTEYPRDLEDVEVLSTARDESRVLITDDRDFGELVVRHSEWHTGVIFLRLETTDIRARCSRLDDVLQRFGHDLSGFVIVTESDIRVRPQKRLT